MLIRILWTGDIHLGRRPTRLPETVDPYNLRPTSIWQSFVSVAIERKVDAVVLTGDIVDESNKFYEAFSVLHSGVRSLTAQGIPVIAVSGNHDFDVLPRLSDQIPDFHLLGRGGQWQDYILEQDGVSSVRFQGWSFPTRHVSYNPLAQYVPPSDELPTVGVLHCDCNVPRSIYGPVNLADLKARNPAAWLLGHVHKPTLLSESYPLILYPGSLQGLDPGEPGAHGAWLVTLGTGRDPTAESLPLAGLRWEEIEVSLSQQDDETSLERAVIDALRERHEKICDEAGQTRTVGCRLRLIGRTGLHRRLPSLIPAIQSDLKPEFDDVAYFIEKIENMSRPDISLEDIARTRDPAGLLAHRLLILERREPSSEYQELISNAKRPIEESQSKNQFLPLPNTGKPMEEEKVRGLLLQAGHRMPDSLLEQKETTK